MQNNTECQGNGVEYSDMDRAIVLASRLQHSAFDVQRSTFDVPPISPAFDELQATQARANLIEFTKTFFGLDADCAFPPDNLPA